MSAVCNACRRLTAGNSPGGYSFSHFYWSFGLAKRYVPLRTYHQAGQQPGEKKAAILFFGFRIFDFGWANEPANNRVANSRVGGSGLHNIELQPSAAAALALLSFTFQNCRKLKSWSLQKKKYWGDFIGGDDGFANSQCEVQNFRFSSSSLLQFSGSGDWLLELKNLGWPAVTTDKGYVPFRPPNRPPQPAVFRASASTVLRSRQGWGFEER